MTNRDIITAIEAVCPPECQESWDNSGWQVGSPGADCTGALLCVDVTEAILDEAVAKGCNLVIAHHPLLFRATRQLTGRNRVERCVAKAFERGISVYSAHTSCDCAVKGVSIEMAGRLGLQDVEPLMPDGLGAIGNLAEPKPWKDFLNRVKSTFGVAALRHSIPPAADYVISRVALCGGAGGDLLPDAADKGADVLVTADCKLNFFLDDTDRIMLVDAGHFETEQCTKDIFYRAVTEKFPNFAVWKSNVERNPVEFF